MGDYSSPREADQRLKAPLAGSQGELRPLAVAIVTTMAGLHDAIDTMEDRPLVGTTDWRRHALVLDVAAAAATIAFGAGLSGEGELLVSQLAFEEITSEVPVTAGPIAHGSRRTSTSARPSSPGRLNRPGFGLVEAFGSVRDSASRWAHPLSQPSQPPRLPRP
jgi:hypothetical protein